MRFWEGRAEGSLGRFAGLVLLDRKGVSGWILRLEGLDSKSVVPWSAISYLAQDWARART